MKIVNSTVMHDQVLHRSAVPVSATLLWSDPCPLSVSLGNLEKFCILMSFRADRCTLRAKWEMGTSFAQCVIASHVIGRSSIIYFVTVSSHYSRPPQKWSKIQLDIKCLLSSQQHRKIDIQVFSSPSNQLLNSTSHTVSSGCWLFWKSYLWTSLFCWWGIFSRL